MKHLRTLQRIRWYIADHGWLCGVFVVPLAILFTIMVFADRLHVTTATRGRAVEKWPLVEASILSAKITEVNASSEIHFGTRLSVAAKFAYEIENTKIQTDYAATWDRADFRDWSEVLAPGGSIRLRVSPDDSSRVSLWDHNRVP